MKRVGVLGGGAWGTALAQVCARARTAGGACRRRNARNQGFAGVDINARVFISDAVVASHGSTRRKIRFHFV